MAQEHDTQSGYPSDRDLLVALFNAVGGLANKLTGETLVVTLKSANGEERRAYYDNGAIEWVVPGCRPSVPSESDCRHSALQ